MAKKLAPLVIPTVLDTSGISRGVANIRNRLRGVGGAGGTGTGGAGFSSGVVPYGMGDGNGSGASAAMAAAFGASAGARANGSTGRRFGPSDSVERALGWRAEIAQMGKGPGGRERLRNLRTSSFGGSILQRIADYAQEKNQAYGEIVRRINIEHRSGKYPWRGPTGSWMHRSNPDYRDAQFGQQRWDKLYRRANVAGTTYSGIQKALANEVGLLGPFGSLAGIGYMASQFGPNAMFDRFQDVSNLRGAQREMAYAMKRRLFQRGKEASLGQRFFMGTQGMMGPDQPSATERVSGMVSAGVGKVAERAGVVFEHLIFAATDPQRYGMWWAAYLDSDKRGN